MNDFNMFWKNIQILINNNHLDNYITINTNYVYPAFADPHISTINDGLSYYNILKNINSLNISNKLNLSDEFYTNFLYDYKDVSLFNYTTDCISNGLHGLSILPDGTICNCFLDYILTTQEY